MEFTFEVSGRLPCLNDMINKAQYNRYAYATLKKKWTAYVGSFIVKEHVPLFSNPYSVTVKFIEPNYRRDIDGVASGGLKFILDALVDTFRVPGDNRVWFKELHVSFPKPDKENPRVIVTLRELEEHF